MDHSLVRREKARAKRIMRVRKAVRGTADKPRLTVSKTNRHLYVQLINDEQGLTLAGIGSLSKGVKGDGKSKAAARKIGALIAERAKEQKIERVVFDRGRYKFHGIIAEMAQAAREAGLQF
jgi:large subunit ribosomal protein L18